MGQCADETGKPHGEETLSADGVSPECAIHFEEHTALRVAVAVKDATLAHRAKACARARVKRQASFETPGAAVAILGA